MSDMSMSKALEDLARAYEEQRRPGSNHLMTEPLAQAIETVLATRGRVEEAADEQFHSPCGCGGTGCIYCLGEDVQDAPGMYDEPDEGLSFPGLWRAVRDGVY